MKNSKKLLITIGVILLVIINVVVAVILINNNGKKEKELPLPEVTGGQRGQLGIDKNINESNIDEYLNRSDSVYRDMRMLEDPATYENIGGDKYLSGYVKGFEIVSLPYLIPVTGLPEAVGETYKGKTLFDIDEDGKYIANYEESIKIIEELFPKDKVIFLMCGGGGYAGMTKQFLVSLGYDETKIYNVGGYWYYDGENNIKVEKTESGFDFSKVPYHEIKFDLLTEIKKETKLPIYLDDKYYGNKEGKEIDKLNLYAYKDEYTALAGTEQGKEIEEKVDNIALEYGKKIDQMLDNKESFVLLVTAGDFCYSSVAGQVDLFNNMINLSEKNNLYYYNLGLKVYKNSRLYKTIKYAPTVIIVYKGDVLAYIDAESDEDLKYTNSYEEFEKWFTSYVKVTK